MSPDYYKGKSGNMEAWDYIYEHDLDYFLGNAIKYITRAGKKEVDPREDIRKAIMFLWKKLELLNWEKEKGDI